MSEALRHAIETSVHTRYRIAKETGLSQASVDRFLRDERSLTLDSVDALAMFLGLELTETQGRSTVRNTARTPKGRTQ